MGHITPITIRLKDSVKKLYSSEFGLKWDDGIPAQVWSAWEELIKMLVTSETLEFPRWVYIENEDDCFYIVAFWDGSDAAYSAVVYIIKHNDNDMNQVKLLTSKSKVAPDWEVNTVRMEMNGAVLCTRITLRAIRALHVKPKKVWFLGDSETVLASREKPVSYTHLTLPTKRIV